MAKHRTKVLILGAGGQIAHWVIRMLAESKDVELTLFLRHPKSLSHAAPGNAWVVQGDVMDRERLDEAMAGQDMVYINLAGELDAQMKNIIASMKQEDVRRAVFIASLGIYDEVPGKFGQWNRRELGPYLGPYRRAADRLEHSGLDYTILRPAWLTDDDEVAYETTQRPEPFNGTEVSRKSVASIVVDIIKSPSLYSKSNIGIDKPGTTADKPAFL